MNLTYDYGHVPTVARFSACNAFIRALIGPFGSGKSSGCVVEIPYRAMQQQPGQDGVRRTKWAVIRNTYGQLRDTTIPTFHRWLPPEYFGRWYAGDHRYVVTAFPGCEFEVLFRALDKPQHIRNLLSLDLTGAWLNEVREIPWPVVEAVQGRVGRYPPMDEGGATWSGIWMDTNPPDSDSKFYKFFEDKDWIPDFEELRRNGGLPPWITRPEHFARIFHQPSGLARDAENLPGLQPGYYQRLQIGKTKEWKKVYIDGDYGFVTDNKAVFPEYSDHQHLKEMDPIPNAPIQRNWDFGLTPAVSFSQDLPDGRWLVFDEMIATSMGIDRFSDQVLTHCSRAFRGHVEFDDIGDPAGEARAQTDERTCFEILHGKGIRIYGGEQNLALRLESMRKPLRTLGERGEPVFILHPRCKNIRKGFLGGYHHRRLATTSERYSDEPEKSHPYSDLMDGLEYRASDMFGGGLTRSTPEDDIPPPPRDMSGRSPVTGY